MAGQMISPLVLVLVRRDRTIAVLNLNFFSFFFVLHSHWLGAVRFVKDVSPFPFRENCESYDETRIVLGIGTMVSALQVFDTDTGSGRSGTTGKYKCGICVYKKKIIQHTGAVLVRLI